MTLITNQNQKMELILSNPEQISHVVSLAVKKAFGEIDFYRESSANDPWLTNSQAQEYLGVSVATLARMRASGALPYSKVGKSIYYRRADIEHILEKNLRQSTSQEVAK